MENLNTILTEEELEKESYRIQEFNFWRFQYSCRKFLLEIRYGLKLKDNKFEVRSKNQLARLGKKMQSKKFKILLSHLILMSSAFKKHTDHEEIYLNEIPEQEKKLFKTKLNMYYN